MNPLLVQSKGESDIKKLRRWNRRAWQEITILRSRVEQIEGKLEMDTGGDSEWIPEGDPWDVEVVYRSNPRMFTGIAIVSFVLGILVCAFFTVG